MPEHVWGHFPRYNILKHPLWSHSTLKVLQSSVKLSKFSISKNNCFLTFTIYCYLCQQVFHKHTDSSHQTVLTKYVKVAALGHKM